MTLDGAKGSGILRSRQTELPVTYKIKRGKDALQSDTVRLHLAFAHETIDEAGCPRWRQAQPPPLGPPLVRLRIAK